MEIGPAAYIEGCGPGEGVVVVIAIDVGCFAGAADDGEIEPAVVVIVGTGDVPVSGSRQADADVGETAVRVAPEDLGRVHVDDHGDVLTAIVVEIPPDERSVYLGIADIPARQAGDGRVHPRHERCGTDHGELAEVADVVKGGGLVGGADAAGGADKFPGGVADRATAIERDVCRGGLIGGGQPLADREGEAGAKAAAGVESVHAPPGGELLLVAGGREVGRTGLDAGGGDIGRTNFGEVGRQARAAESDRAERRGLAVRAAGAGRDGGRHPLAAVHVGQRAGMLPRGLRPLAQHRAAAFIEGVIGDQPGLRAALHQVHVLPYLLLAAHRVPDTDFVHAAVKVAAAKIRAEAHRIGVEGDDLLRPGERDRRAVDVEGLVRARFDGGQVPPETGRQPQAGGGLAIELDLRAVLAEIPAVRGGGLLADQPLHAGHARGLEPEFEGVGVFQAQLGGRGNLRILAGAVEDQRVSGGEQGGRSPRHETALAAVDRISRGGGVSADVICQAGSQAGDAAAE